MVRFGGDLGFGVMTSSYANWGNNEIAGQLATIDGIVEVEISAVNEKGKRMQDAADHVSAHLPVYSFIENPVETAEAFAKIWNDKGIGVSIGNYDRHHSNHAMDDLETLDYTMRCIDFAAALGGKNGGARGVDVGIFWGWNRNQSIVENISAITEKLYVLASYAQQRGVRLTTENCHMPGGWSEANEIDWVPAVFRSAGGRLAFRDLIYDNLIQMGINPDTLGETWDASHAETEAHPDSRVEARLQFEREAKANERYADRKTTDGPIIVTRMYHVKGHNHKDPANLERMAQWGGPALAGIHLEADHPLAKQFKKLGYDVSGPGDQWNQQYGTVTYAGDANDITPYKDIIEIARGAGFSGRVIGENESPAKGAALDAGNIQAITDMHKTALKTIKPFIWQGDTYQGPAFKPLVVDKATASQKGLSYEGARQLYITGTLKSATIARPTGK